MAKLKLKIQGYKKTTHFIERQSQRKVSDKQVQKAIKQGSSSENEEGYIIYRLAELTVVTDPISKSLVTVHAEGDDLKNPKIISLEVARTIKAEIDSFEESYGQSITNDFYMEMHRERVKVLEDVEEEKEEEGVVISLEDYLKKSA